MSGKHAPGASALVDVMMGASLKPSTNRRQLRAAAEAMLAGTEDTADQAWLHIIIARTLGDKRLEQTLSHYRQAHSLSKGTDLKAAYAQALIGLYGTNIKLERREEANRYRDEGIEAGLITLSDALASVGAAVTDKVGSLMVRVGGALTRLGHDVVTNPLPSDSKPDKPKPQG